MAFDSSSPEGVLDQWSEKKKRMAACDNQQVTEINRRRMNWRKKVFGVLPVLWIAIGITTFAIGIAIGGIAVSATASEIAPQASSQSPLNLSSTSSPSHTTTSSRPSPRSTSLDPSIPTPGVSITAASTFLSTSGVSTSAFLGVATLTFSGAATSTISAVSDSENFQTFTGALGGIAADPFFASNDTVLPYEVDSESKPDLASALQHSYNNQQTEYVQPANMSGGVFTVE
ncbi:hypothetical protein V8E51_011213 [Hyaloscypha variabilis]